MKKKKIELTKEMIIKQLEINEFAELKLNFMKHPQLYHLFLEVTSRCNAHCDHCGSRCDAKEQGKEISAEALKSTLADIAKHYDPTKILLNVTGGEPLLRKDLFDILEYATSLGFPWGMTSNGILIDKAMVKKLEKAKMCTVSISIDGLEKTHEEFRHVKGCYNKILKGIEMMQKSNVIQIVQVTTVVSKKNIHELEELYKLLLKHHVKYWRVVNCDPIGRANDNKEILLDKDDFKYLFKFIQEKSSEGKMIDVSYGCSHYLGLNLEKKVRGSYFICMTGYAVGSILSNGDIFVCPNVPRRKELIQGNILKDNFVEVWEKKFKPFRKENRTSNRKCRRCKDWNICRGDAFHTWNFDEKKPNICLRDIFDEV